MVSAYVLVHGRFAGAWVWEKVVPLLRGEGHEVEAPDMTGRGEDKTPVPEISLGSYTDRVCWVLDSHAEPVILVGHSSGGAVISQVAEYRPDKVELLVYLSAYMPCDGGSVLQLGQQDTESLLMPNLILDEQRGTARIRDDADWDLLYADCPEGDAARAMSLMGHEPLAAGATPVNITGENFGYIPRAYIGCGSCLKAASTAARLRTAALASWVTTSSWPARANP
jgi:pimeloyl-ACP methyl ester carboxylesterase